mgnify:FL=1
MKLTKNISFKNYKTFKKSKKILNILNQIKKEDNKVLESMKKNYGDSFDKKKIPKYKKYSEIRLFGIGGSSLGAQSIYEFLKYKIKKNFLFLDNLDVSGDNKKKK